jgi:hypothetical protein
MTRPSKARKWGACCAALVQQSGRRRQLRQLLVRRQVGRPSALPVEHGDQTVLDRGHRAQQRRLSDSCVLNRFAQQSASDAARTNRDAALLRDTSCGRITRCNLSRDAFFAVFRDLGGTGYVYTRHVARMSPGNLDALGSEYMLLESSVAHGTSFEKTGHFRALNEAHPHRKCAPFPALWTSEPCLRKSRGLGRSPTLSAPVSVFGRRGGSPLQACTLRPVTDSNCVLVKGGGEQLEVNEQSAG